MADSTKPDRDRKVIIIGLMSSTGPQSGKSTITDKIITKLYSYRKDKDDKFLIRKMSLAADLKMMALLLFKKMSNLHNIDPGDKERVLISEEILGRPYTLRQFFIDLGMSGRAVDEDFWIDRVRKKIDKEVSKCPEADWIFIFDDIRFQNEVEKLVDGYNKSILINLVNVDSERPDSTDLTPVSCKPDITIYNEVASDLVDRQITAKVFPLIKKVLRDEV